jgi:hypothetical protein
MVRDGKEKNSVITRAKKTYIVIPIPPTFAARVEGGDRPESFTWWLGVRDDPFSWQVRSGCYGSSMRRSLVMSSIGKCGECWRGDGQIRSGCQFALAARADLDGPFLLSQTCNQREASQGAVTRTRIYGSSAKSERGLPLNLSSRLVASHLES